MEQVKIMRQLVKRLEFTICVSGHSHLLNSDNEWHVNEVLETQVSGV